MTRTESSAPPASCTPSGATWTHCSRPTRPSVPRARSRASQASREALIGVVAKASELPVIQPSRYELVIDMKTAQDA
jgi:hypothetical protein